ncbi:MAG: V-type ATPase 116kDa subunit family protein [bacterium]
MITKMTKYNFLVYHAQYNTFIEKLRNVGVLHIATLEQGSDSYEFLREKFALQNRIYDQIDYCVRLAQKSPDKVVKRNPALSIADGMEIITDLKRLQQEKEVLQQDVTTSERELQRMQVWGKFSKEKIDELVDTGYIVGFYSCSSRAYSSDWEERYNAFAIDTFDNITYFVTITKDEITDLEAEPFKLSELSYEEIEQSIVDIKKDVAAKEAEIEAFALNNLDNIKQLDLMVEKEIVFDTVYMNTEKAADETVMILEGYCPDNVCLSLLTMLEEDNIYYIESEPTEEDKVPVKLRNNAFTRLFEPLTGMYGTPVYQEYDPTPILAPFFLLFFAMCMGDGGYGLLLILFGLAVKFNKINIEMFSGLGNIITVLGVGTTIVGFFLGTAFGIDMYNASYIPEALKSCMIKGEVAGYDIQMILAIAIGIFHICLAITIKAVGYTKRFGFKANISTWGWLLLIVGGLVTSVMMLGNVIPTEVANIALIAIGAISALGIYIFNDPKRNVFVNIGAGLWDTYNMATGLLGDVLSYIRLYALGLAGGMLGGAFNNLGAMILGDEPSIIMWLPYILILIFGHTLNLVMSSLGAFVHPLRLTFVEYFKNSGYEGKGEKYSPLSNEV